MTSPTRPSELELHAFIDDELSAARHAEIAAIVHDDPALAARVAAYEADRERLRAAFDRFADQPLPPAWAARIEAAMAPPPRSALITRRFAVGAGLAIAASVAGVAWWRWPRADTVLVEAEAARAGRLAGRVPDGGNLPAPDARDALLRSTIGLPVRAPDLQRFGFHLAGIELFNRPAGWAAQLRYTDPDQRVLTVYVRRSDGTVQFDLLRRGKDRVCVWQDDVVGAVIIAPLSGGEMLRIASSAYAALNL